MSKAGLTSAAVWALPRTVWAAAQARPVTLVCGLIGVGVLLRVAGYLQNRSLWLDEVFLTFNLVERSPAELFRPLDYEQAAPVGFLLLTKLLAEAFDYSEYALRLVPLLSGIASLGLCYAVARRCLSPAAVPVAVGLFAVSPSLLYLAYEAKPYAGDVAVTLLLILVTVEADRQRLASRAIALVGLVGVAAVWFSQPSVLVLGGVGAGVLAAWRREPSRRALGGLLLVGAVTATSIAAAYLAVLRHYARDAYFRDVWAVGFMPLPPRELNDFLWFPFVFFEMFDEAGLRLSALAGVAFLVGGWVVLREAGARGLIFLTPLLATVVAAALRVYPMYGRPMVFLIPVLLLLVAEGVDRIRRATAATLPMLGPLLVGLLFLHPVVFAAQSFVALPGREELRPVVQYLQANRREGDVVYVYYAAQFAFRYYAARLGLKAGDVIIGVAARDDWRGYRKDLERLRGSPRVWIVFSHVYRKRGIDEERFFLYHVDQLGAQRDSFVRPGASVYLYDLSPGATPRPDSAVSPTKRQRHPQWDG